MDGETSLVELGLLSFRPASQQPGSALAGVTTDTWLSGSPKKWQHVTPAMAAGITDHVWTMEELLSYRVPPDFRDALEQQEIVHNQQAFHTRY